ncbi:hypothetical protein J7T55_000128 [Diaporthe amygdali]|uniref:uncharacterized protein n=1 Tax=Phomopsis amygdali TaxID=1214568 RepID=UPI0022FDC09E|nr:uncharacterized protein J7T55_000128 [Diaporthe amygdali]KAJ0108163.1 hypothetical protein J7T55_000128 [Diaporthe amygdali]
MLASLTSTAISLAWAAGPRDDFYWWVYFPPPLYGLPCPLLSLVWQSAEFFKTAMNSTATGFSASSHLICNLLLGAAGFALAIPMLVLTERNRPFMVEWLEDTFELEYPSDWPEVTTMLLWLSSVFMWGGMALVASVCHFALFIFAYLEVRRAYKALGIPVIPATAPAPPHLQPSSKLLLTSGLAAEVHRFPSEVLTHEAPQEVDDVRMVVEMPGTALDDRCLSAVSVGGITRSNEQDSLQQDM